MTLSPGNCSAATFTAEERAWLAQHPVVRVAINPQWAPVEFVDRHGAPRGMSLAQRLSQRLP